MPFDDVYRVSTRSPTVPGDEIDEFARDLPVPLPLGYREYLVSLGRGELCDLLRVRTPAEVRKYLANEEEERERYGYVDGIKDGWWDPCALQPEDLEEAITFSSSAEGDSFVCCPRFGSDLFELPRHGSTIELVRNGFYGAVANSVQRMQHDFPFFEPEGDERRRYRGFDVKPGMGLQRLLAEVKRRWGAKGLRRSRTASDETNPNLFVRPIEGRLVLYLEPNERLPPGAYTVAMSYDIESESDVAAFVDSIRLQGGNSWVR